MISLPSCPSNSLNYYTVLTLLSRICSKSTVGKNNGAFNYLSPFRKEVEFLFLSCIGTEELSTHWRLNGWGFDLG